MLKFHNIVEFFSNVLEKALMKSQFNFSLEMLIVHSNQTLIFVTHQIVKTSNRVCVYVIRIRLLIHLFEYERQNTFTLSGSMFVYQLNDDSTSICVFFNKKFNQMCKFQRLYLYKDFKIGS